MHSLGLSVLLALPVIHASTSMGRSMVVHERLEAIPTGFVAHGSAPGHQSLSLRLALVSNNLVGLEDALMAVSTPGSARYGQFLTKEEVETFVAPSQSSVDAVTTYLSAHGLNATPFSPAGDWLSLDLTVTQANTIFDTQFSTFAHVETGAKSVRALQYSIPTALRGHLDFVHPTITFPHPINHGPVLSTPLSKGAATSRSSNSNAVPASCKQAITPACLQALYGIPTAKATQSSSVLGVSGLAGSFANRADLHAFLEAFRPDLSPSTTFAIQSVDNGKADQNISQAGREADLDIQYTVGVASGVPVTFITVGPSETIETPNEFIASLQNLMTFLLGERNPPTVLTTSYGLDEVFISQPLATSLCNAYMQLGARGTSIIFASGDGGVSGGHTENCTQFNPTFPSVCPYVTSVGATTGVPETAAYFSSGGFSNHFAAPTYQRGAVADYMAKLGGANRGLFNASGRAWPDVAAQGNNFLIVNQGQTRLIGGTSASAPTFASVIALLNDELVAAGKRPLGFLNPFLYSTGKSAMNDITTGNNPGCNTDGFPAMEGWDPVTGLGTPNFAALRKAVGL
ncbi:family S53 protease [Artomyces pyxidatus]|uniref:Family S53 protease n=1 Tax=Artomyces pyxidatus TaxID=48021 RepID=A0ACB8SI93_9AGAM|nr:family S53 protease [Artomyces pyxidatus]